jgi:hypothetical protein
MPAKAAGVPDAVGTMLPQTSIVPQAESAAAQLQSDTSPTSLINSSTHKVAWMRLGRKMAYCEDEDCVKLWSGTTAETWQCMVFSDAFKGIEA